MSSISIGSVLSRVDKFLAEAVKKPAAPPRGSLVFALDATMSRQPTWDLAVHLQGAMFNEVASLGVLDVKMVYFRGAHGIDAECKASQWMNGTAQVAKFMKGIACLGGLTQIGKVLEHVLKESDQRRINAMIYIGDSVEELRVNLVPLARRLADQNIPIFVFQENNDPHAEEAFRELADITHGAYQRFDQGSAKQLGELLKAVATFATGGIAALEKQGSDAAKLLLGQIR
jgi:hypothetical protein